MTNKFTGSKNIFHLDIVESKSITFNDDICPTTTGQVFSNYPYLYTQYILIAATAITSEHPSEAGGPSLSGGVIAAILAVVVPAALY